MSDTKRIKLLYLVNDCNYFISHRLPVALACHKQGYEVHVAGPLSPSESKILGYGLHYHRIDLGRRGLNPLHELPTLVAIYRLYRSLRPDLVHHVAVKAVLFGSVVSRLARVPAVVNALTGLGYVFISNSLKARLLRFFVMRGYKLGFGHPGCRVLFQNGDDADLFVLAGVARRNQVTVIRGSGVDINHYVPKAGELGDPLVVLPSRMLWDKGVGEFVAAAEALKGRGVRARFVLVGDTYAANPASIPGEKLQQWKKQGNVEWWGHCNDMQEIFRQAHIICLPSYREGLPKALIEAAACGRAIVTTDVPGCREVVQDGMNGYLVPVKDSDSLAEKLQQLIERPELRYEMGIRGRELAVSEFAVERVIERTLHCYEELLGCRSY